MSTVGRIGWMRALTKVFTRSRGTPAAALAMYCSRKVFVDTELDDYSICLPGAVPKQRWLAPEVPATLARLFREVRTRSGTDPDVLVDRARDARIDRAGAADRRAEMDDVRLRTVGMAVRRDAVTVNHASARAVFAHLDGREPRSPRRLPEVPALVAEGDAGAEAVVDEVFLVRLAVDDPESHGDGHGVVTTAFLHGEPVIVRGDV